MGVGAGCRGLRDWWGRGRHLAGWRRGGGVAAARRTLHRLSRDSSSVERTMLPFTEQSVFIRSTTLVAPNLGAQCSDLSLT